MDLAAIECATPECVKGSFDAILLQHAELLDDWASEDGRTPLSITPLSCQQRSSSRSAPSPPLSLVGVYLCCKHVCIGGCSSAR